jgi:integrase
MSSELTKSAVQNVPTDTRASSRSLPVEQWPTADRLAWEAACRPAARLKRGGAAGHLKEITRKDLSRRYGYFLNFVQHAEGLDPNAAYVTPDRVARYEAELQKRVGSVTLYGSIYKLRRTAQLLNPAGDFGWLCDLEKDLALLMKPRSKLGRLAYSYVLLRAGLALMIEADTIMTGTELQRAQQFRNGLLIAFLASHPIRLKNLAELELGRTFHKVDNDWWIVLPATETKENRRDERKVEPTLLPWVKKYLEKYRPALNHLQKVDDRFLWSSSRGGRFTYGGIERAIKATTLASVGVDVCPHLFRTSAASTVAASAPSTPGLAAALLHHIDPSVTEEHYNRARSIDASRAFGALIRHLGAA